MKTAEEAWKNWGIPVYAFENFMDIDMERLSIWVEMRAIEEEAKARLEAEAIRKAKK